ncbi:ABC transporter ATP-binding protein [Candidatus Parcubacteria bacterium]|nr:ABC transporter ATP-binding protein [Candidatus Parcubacteria bacterium]
MEPIIEVKNISKKYNIARHQGGYVAMRDILTNIAKKPFSFIKNKAKKLVGKAGKEEFWALKNISFSVEKGEAIGIIGANGAGKSTLLKVLSEITPPTTGEININGRLSSLLEVGTGFHPELSGRENIFLNGAILGMTKKEISDKFDDIVEFAGINKFIDTPVKRYSSGMYVRLAFSVAAHTEPDILLVDEVLAVGDANFQKKCLGKMDEVTKKNGRTILFVSHNMDAILKLCSRCILLKNGKITMFDESRKVVNTYLQNNPLSQESSSLEKRTDRKGLGNIKISSFFVENQEGKKVDYLITGKYYTFCIGYKSKNNYNPKNVSITLAISNENGSPLILASSKLTKQDFDIISSNGIIRCKINQKFPLTEGIYNIAIDLFSNGQREDFIKNFGVFEVKQGDFYDTGIYIKHSPFYLEQDWSLQTN